MYDMTEISQYGDEVYNEGVSLDSIFFTDETC